MPLFFAKVGLSSAIIAVSAVACLAVFYSKDAEDETPFSHLPIPAKFLTILSNVCIVSVVVSFVAGAICALWGIT